MGFDQLLLTAVGLAMDAFAVSVCLGLSAQKPTFKSALTAGLYFSGFQALMPLAGYFVGYWFADYITAFDHWIAFVLLAFIGGKMVKESFDASCPQISGSPGVRKMMTMAIATSIDALAVGVSFAFLKMDIILSVVAIGIVTFVLSVVGVKAGGLLGERFKSRAELAGGIILILIGANILREHLFTVG